MSNTSALSQLLRLGLALQAQASSHAIERKFGRGLLAFGLAIFASMLAFGAFILCLAALWLYLAPMTGPVLACLAVAALLTVFALVILLVVRRSMKAKRRALVVQPALLVSTVDVEKSIRKQKPLFLVAALLAGALAASGK